MNSLSTGKTRKTITFTNDIEQEANKLSKSANNDNSDMLKLAVKGLMQVVKYLSDYIGQMDFITRNSVWSESEKDK